MGKAERRRKMKKYSIPGYILVKNRNKIEERRNVTDTSLSTI